MAVASTTTMHLSANAERRLVLHDPADASAAQLVDLGQPQGASKKCVPIALFRRFLAAVSLVSQNGGADAITAFSIYAATDEAGSGGVAVVTHALGTAPNAIGDQVNLECNVEQVHETLSTATHVGVWLDCTHADDKVAVYFESTDALHPRAGLTTDYIS